MDEPAGSTDETVQPPQGAASSSSEASSSRPIGPRPGDRVGAYTLERELARGGMGKVYVAAQEGANRKVALKIVLLDSDALSEEGLKRFQLEAEAVARLKHPGIVKIFELGVHEGLPFLAMDLIEGETLQERIERTEPYGPRPAAQLVAALAHAVQHAHDQGILHRDLKPANILLDGEGRARIADFGLARDMHETRERLTRTGQTLGTPAYMPPEQANGDLQAIGPCSDVYSLGAILYAVLTSRPPFTGASAVTIIYKVLREDPDPPDTDDALRAICLMCLAKNPKQRYGSAGELADDLDRFLTGEPVLARPPMRRWAKRIIAITAILALTAILGGGYLGWTHVRDTRIAELDASQRAIHDVQSGMQTWVKSKPLLRNDQPELAEWRSTLAGWKAPDGLDETTRAQATACRQKLSLLEGLTALAQQDLPEAKRAMESLANGSPNHALLRGAICTVEQSGNARAARDGLMPRTPAAQHIPDVVLWRALARARAGFESDESAQDALRELDASPYLESTRERRARAWAHLRLGHTEEAQKSLGEDTPSPQLLRVVCIIRAWTLLEDPEPRIAEAFALMATLEDFEDVPWDRAEHLHQRVVMLTKRAWEAAAERRRTGTPTTEEQEEDLLQLTGMAQMLKPKNALPDDLKGWLTRRAEELNTSTSVFGDAATKPTLETIMAMAGACRDDYAALKEVVRLGLHLSESRRQPLAPFARRAWVLAPPDEHGEAGLYYLDFIAHDQSKRVLTLSADLESKLRSADHRQRYHELRARALLRLSRPEKALKEIERGLQVAPSRHRLFKLKRMRAVAFKALRRLPEAYPIARDLLRAGATTSWERAQMQSIVWDHGLEHEKPEDLAETLRIAIGNTQNYPGYRLRLALLCFKLGRFPEAAEQLRLGTTNSGVWDSEQQELRHAARDEIELVGSGDAKAGLRLKTIVEKLDALRAGGFEP